MLSLYGVSAWIEVDGKEVEQYGVEEDPDQSQVTCWIATQVGKNFSVVFRDNATHREHSLCSSVDLDGSSVSGKVLRPSSFGNLPNSVASRTAVQNDQTLSATSSRPFIFSKLELTDEDEYLNQASTHLGEICIRIHRAQACMESVPVQPGFVAPGHGKIHERSKKAVTHCVSYGQEAQTATRYACDVKYLDGNNPLAIFVFKYRDSSLLQANGIIPKPPPAKKKATICDEVLDLTTGDVVKAEPLGKEIEIIDGATQKRVRGLLSKRPKTNPESEARQNKRIKRENKYVPSGEVIDLT